MKNLIQSGLLFIIFFTNDLFAEQTCNESGLQSSVVKISSSPNNTASGILIADDLVLTVLHALPAGQKLHIDFLSHTEEAELIHSHHGFDLALLKTKNKLNHEIKISKTNPAITRVLAASYPLNSPFTLTYGQKIKSTYKGLLTSTEIEAGSSGGAILQCQDSVWYLAGVIRSYAAHVDGNKLVNSGLTWSIPSEYVLSFLENVNLNKFEPIAFVADDL